MKLLRCYCSGDCPDNKLNGTCFAKPNSKCFAAVEEVFDADTNSFEKEFSYGCLPPEEATLMQCKGHLVPHQVPKSILCCSDSDYCNRYLEPTYTKIPNPDSPFNLNFDQYFLFIFPLSIFFVFIVLGIIAHWAINKYKRNKNERKNHYYDETHNLYRSTEKPLKQIMIDSTMSSGSGSGEPLLVQRTIGKQIDLIKSIGKGRYGEVWKACWRGDYYAAKVFFTTEEDSWIRETGIYQTVLLRHPNILGFVASDIRGTGSWTQMLLITDYHENGSLHDYLKLRVLDTQEGLKLAYTAVCGISHLHIEIFGKQGKPAIAHRDIKSKNILVKRDGSCVIADLNLAIRSDNNKIDDDTNVKVGTKRYMAPEILDDTIVTNNFESFKMADMYSLGLVLWEIARRCTTDCIVDEYMVPYAEYVPNDPSFEEMKKIVCIENIRPNLSPRWYNSKSLEVLAKIMKECWNAQPHRRVTALRVKKTLRKEIEFL